MARSQRSTRAKHEDAALYAVIVRGVEAWGLRGRKREAMIADACGVLGIRPGADVAKAARATVRRAG